MPTPPSVGYDSCMTRALYALLLSSCAAVPEPTMEPNAHHSAAPSSPPSPTVVSSTTQSPNGEASYYDGAGRRIDSQGAPRGEVDRWQSRSIDRHEPVAARPPRVGRRNIQLHHARLDNALRMLAREGRFNLVINGDLNQSISVDLRAVDPYEALLAIAHSHGVDVQYQGNIVIVSRDD